MPPDAASCLATMKRAPDVPMKMSFIAESPNFGDFLERGRRLAAKEALIEGRHRRQSVDLLDGLVRPQADDPWKAERVSTLVPSRVLDRVEGHFDDRLRLHDPDPPAVDERRLQEVLRHFRALRVGQARVRLSHVDKLARLLVDDRQGQVPGKSTPPSVTPPCRP